MYVDPQISSPLGFSRVIYWGEQQGFIACHGDAGIVRWLVSNTAEPHSRLSCARLCESYPGAGSEPKPRNLQILSTDRVVFSFGNTLLGIDSDENTFSIPTGSQAEIVAIVPENKQIIVAHEDGMICAIDRSTLEITCKQRTGSRVVAAGGLPWLGSTRLLLAGEDGSIQCVGVDDPLVTQYASVHRGPRVVAGSENCVAAVSADRQRLILWNTWDGRQPVAEIYVTGLTRHRVADVDFA